MAPLENETRAHTISRCRSYRTASTPASNGSCIASHQCSSRARVSPRPTSRCWCSTWAASYGATRPPATTPTVLLTVWLQRSPGARPEMLTPAHHNRSISAEYPSGIQPIGPRMQSSLSLSLSILELTSRYLLVSSWLAGTTSRISTTSRCSTRPRSECQGIVSNRSAHE